MQVKKVSRGVPPEAFNGEDAVATLQKAGLLLLYCSESWNNFNLSDKP